MDLATRYLGLELRNPLVASASPLSNTVDGVRRLADAGVGAVVLFSMFEEQLRREAAQNVALADVARYLLAGADVVMTASALIRHGVAHAGVLLDGLSAWMSRKRFASLADVRGLLSVPSDADGATYERSGYVTALQAANRGESPW
jgi:dihydroorotate dehydrogenase